MYMISLCTGMWKKCSEFLPNPLVTLRPGIKYRKIAIPKVICQIVYSHIGTFVYHWSAQVFARSQIKYREIAIRISLFNILLNLYIGLGHVCAIRMCNVEWYYEQNQYHKCVYMTRAEVRLRRVVMGW